MSMDCMLYAASLTLVRQCAETPEEFIPRLAEHAQATAEVETLLSEGLGQPMNLHTFAQVHAICAAAAAKDAQLPPSEREKLADRYGGRAVELLRKAQDTGYFRDPGRLARLKDSDDFDSVRSRPVIR